MPVCCNYIHVGLYVFFVGVLRVRRVAAGLVSFHFFRPVGLNCCCVQQTFVFQICSGFIKEKRKSPVCFHQEFPLKWFYNSITTITCNLTLFLSSSPCRSPWYSLTRKKFVMKMVWFCIALFIHAERLGPVGLWADEMTELEAREHDDG